MVILIRRHIDLIQLLIQQNKCKPASFFGEELHVSSKTIYSDIHELEVFIKDTFNKLGYKAKINTHTTSYIN